MLSVAQSMADGPIIEDAEERARLRAERRKAKREAAVKKVLLPPPPPPPPPVCSSSSSFPLCRLVSSRLVSSLLSPLIFVFF